MFSPKWISSDANGAIRRSFTTFEYDNYTADSTHAFLIPRSDITGLCTTFGSNGVCANLAPQTYVTRGNPTSVTSYMQPASPATGPVTVAMQYDIAGNMIKFLDPRSIASGLYYATTIDYSDRFGGPDHEARGNTGPAELNGNPLKHTYAFATLITNPFGHTAYSQFDYYLGQPDQLGTPRLILDETGLLANVKRHDYLPFGEELMSQGLRNASLGYATGDGIRQQFTLKERDIETGLDYFLARYYSPIHGRFLSSDEFSGGPSDISVLGSGSSEKQALAYATVSNPQSLNKYQYGFNNPLRFVDPDGHKPQEGLEIRMRRNEKAFAEGKITREEFIARTREQVGQMFLEGAGGPPGLTLAPNSRLRATEIDCLERLAKQIG